MARLDVEQWAAIRREWEEGPLVSFSQLAAAHAVDRTNISRRAGKEGWKKKLKLTAINQAAQRKADARVDSDGNEKHYARRRTDVAAVSPEQSEDLRADVLTRHRKEWAELEQFRRAALAKMKQAHEAGDADLWKIAKAAMDATLSGMRALAVKQGGETRAWGLDTAAEQDDGLSPDHEQNLDTVYREGLAGMQDMPGPEGGEPDGEPEA